MKKIFLDGLLRKLVYLSLLSFLLSNYLFYIARHVPSEGWDDLGEYAIGILVGGIMLVSLLSCLIYIIVGFLMSAKRQQGDLLALVIMTILPGATLIAMFTIYN